MSIQQPQQPALVYPNTVAGQQPPAVHSSSSHSNGSFGTVFIVLAVIVVISAIACCLGRLCNRHHHRSHQSHHKEKPSKKNRSKEKHAGAAGRDMEFEPPKRNHSFRPREREIGNNGRPDDIEFGFDKNIAASKPSAGSGESRVFKQFGNGDSRFEPKFADFGEPKASA